VKIIADTNILSRAVVGDDVKQSRAAIRAMEQAETVVVSQHVLRDLFGISAAATGYRGPTLRPGSANCATRKT
jgi:predicted nucleic acid-binding protein